MSTKGKDLFDYNKHRHNANSLSPRDRQMRQHRTDLSSEESVFELKARLLDLESQLLDLKSGPVQHINYKGKLFTEEEFNDELIKALEKEIAAGAVNGNSVDNKKLLLDLDTKNTYINTLEIDKLKLEKNIIIKENELTTVKIKLDSFETLLKAKDETIESLKSKPVVIESKGSRYVSHNSEPVYKVPSIEVETIDPSAKDVKLESHITIKETKDDSGGDMLEDMGKLREIMNGGV